MNLLSAYDSFVQSNPASGALSLFRQAGFAYAQNKDLPTRKDEEWHYTSVKKLSEIPFVSSAMESQEPSHESLQAIKRYLNPQFTNIVFVNGVLNKTLAAELPEGLTLREPSDYSEQFVDTFDALNGAYSVKPLVFVLAKETAVEKPVNFVFFTSQGDRGNIMVHPRVRVEVGARSSIRLIESYYGQATATYFVNSVFELHVGESANATYIRVQSDSQNAMNIGRTRIAVEKFAQLESLAFATGAILSRHTLDVNLLGAGSNSEVLGIYAVRGGQHVDNTSLINHTVGECNTNQLYKGILDGESRAVFCGKVLIQKDAQKANSAQLNNNLLLSSKAEADSKPSLEIYADDVKAAHGSTVGQLNKEELFYLQSRAISKEKAIPMLSYGFLSEVIYKISDSNIQKWLAQHLDETFAQLTVNG